MRYVRMLTCTVRMSCHSTGRLTHPTDMLSSTCMACLAQVHKSRSFARPFVILDCIMQLSSIGVANEESNRRALRNLLFSAPDIEKYISGVVSCRMTIRITTMKSAHTQHPHAPMTQSAQQGQLVRCSDKSQAHG